MKSLEATQLYYSSVLKNNHVKKQLYSNIIKKFNIEKIIKNIQKNTSNETYNIKKENNVEKNTSNETYNIEKAVPIFNKIKSKFKTNIEIF